MKNIGICLRPKLTSDFAAILPNLLIWLKKRRKRCFFKACDKSKVFALLRSSDLNLEFLLDDEFQEDLDLIISMGGDGTLLGVGRYGKKTSPPIFGINMGRLGFMTPFKKSEIFDYLEPVLTGDFEFQKIPLFKIQVYRKEETPFSGHFLNDAVVSKNGISRMFGLNLDADGDHIYSVRGDGLIISSPIGSTAYSLAAGGPIIYPSVGAFVVTPICPHGLNHRPIVLPDKQKLHLKLPTGSEDVTLTLDGQEVIPLKGKDTLEIQKSRTRYAKVIVNPDRTYFETFKEKFTQGKREF